MQTVVMQGDDLRERDRVVLSDWRVEPCTQSGGGRSCGAAWGCRPGSQKKMLRWSLGCLVGSTPLKKVGEVGLDLRRNQTALQSRKSLSSPGVGLWREQACCRLGPSLPLRYPGGWVWGWPQMPLADSCAPNGAARPALKGASQSPSVLSASEGSSLEYVTSKPRTNCQGERWSRCSGNWGRNLRRSSREGWRCHAQS